MQRLLEVKGDIAMSNSKETILKLDTCGLIQREERREATAKKQEQQEASSAALRRRFDSAFAEERQKIRLRELALADPAMYFFLVKNRNVSSV